ncbi:Iron sulfur cluster scaffold protein 1 [Intoshia linei]|uniref:Iron-sulfur cluster assembly enzyme ISCU n=1 Tax=Intoshia linei TaxID=1819745 RepID=A0A177BD50_9BILA|nr:Iron sulfur cluster scaffold protein 1 [Intoshia linei]
MNQNFIEKVCNDINLTKRQLYLKRENENISKKQKINPGESRNKKTQRIAIKFKNMFTIQLLLYSVNQKIDFLIRKMGNHMNIMNIEMLSTSLVKRILRMYHFSYQTKLYQSNVTHSIAPIIKATCPTIKYKNNERKNKNTPTIAKSCINSLLNTTESSISIANKIANYSFFPEIFPVFISYLKKQVLLLQNNVVYRLVVFSNVLFQNYQISLLRYHREMTSFLFELLTVPVTDKTDDFADTIRIKIRLYHLFYMIFKRYPSKRSDMISVIYNLYTAKLKEYDGEIILVSEDSPLTKEIINIILLLVTNDKYYFQKFVDMYRNDKHLNYLIINILKFIHVSDGQATISCVRILNFLEDKGIHVPNNIPIYYTDVYFSPYDSNVQFLSKCKPSRFSRFFFSRKISVDESIDTDEYMNAANVMWNEIIQEFKTPIIKNKKKHISNIFEIVIEYVQNNTSKLILISKMFSVNLKMLKSINNGKLIRFYHKNVLDHYNNPRNVGSFNKDDSSIGTGIVGAPACGDVMKLQVKVDDDGKIIDAKFKTFGCGSAIASSSLMTTMIIGQNLSHALAIKNTEIANKLNLPPVKLHCSMLAEDAIQAAIKNYKEKKSKPNVDV